jgi:hypothetical protein
MSDNDYVSFGEHVARRGVGQQCQYASRYFTGFHPDHPDLSEGLRFLRLDAGDYHSIRIHKDDVAEAINRVLTHLSEAWGCSVDEVKRQRGLLTE